MEKTLQEIIDAREFDRGVKARELVVDFTSQDFKKALREANPITIVDETLLKSYDEINSNNYINIKLKESNFNGKIVEYYNDGEIFVESVFEKSDRLCEGLRDIDSESSLSKFECELTLDGLDSTLELLKVRSFIISDNYKIILVTLHNSDVFY